MDACMGGELYQWLKAKKRFDNSTTQFYMACVVDAMSYLHR